MLKNIGSDQDIASVIKVESALKTKISGTTFDSNQNTYIESKSSNLTVTDTYFLNGSGESFVSLSDAELNIDKSFFKQNDNPLNSGLGV